MPNPLTRRAFVKSSTTVATGALTGLSSLSAAPIPPPADALHISIFSKHLQFLDYDDMAVAAARMGFDGVDLTVRPGGHVLPENVAADLPRAVAALRKAGLQPGLMATAITRADEEHTDAVLTTAAAQGIHTYRLGYYKFNPAVSVPRSIARSAVDVQILAARNEVLNLRGVYQNHAGLQLGAAIWDIHHLLRDARHPFAGCQYDIRHATVEGGASWPVGLRLIADRITSIVIKDFRWERIDGKWKIHNVPVGEGMVDFPAYFKLLKEYKINVPVSLHCEYDLGGAEHGDRSLRVARERVFGAMEQDLERIRKLWAEA